jgi:hypothetical protein
MGPRLAGTAPALALLLSALSPADAADKQFMSLPIDTKIYARRAMAEDFSYAKKGETFMVSPMKSVGIFQVDAVVSNTDPKLKDDDTVGVRGEVSIAVAPTAGTRLAMTDFENFWGTEASLWMSFNSGRTWTKKLNINPPPGAPGVFGCPCDQTIDFTHTNVLGGVFLTNAGNIYSALGSIYSSSPNPFNYFAPGGAAQPSNYLNPSSLGNADQPWLLVNRIPRGSSALDNVYVAYDDFSGAPDMRVAVAQASGQLRFTTNKLTGFSGGDINPGHRLGVDHNTGAVYSLFQQSPGKGAGGSKNINYMLNRSTDGGKTWSLNGSPTGILVANADSTQPRPKFCTVNALLGGVDHAAVDPATGDVLVVYGNRDKVTGNNRLAMRRLISNGAGGLTVGPELFITGQVQAALPSIAVLENRIIGVFYYTCDGFSPSGFPIFSAHFSRSSNLGASFQDFTLATFLSPVKDDGEPRQRVLFDYMQLKALGNTFYGGYGANRLAFYPASPYSIIDPIFYTLTLNF